MSSLRDRDTLYARLEEVLGAEPAGILMDSIPIDPDVATRADVRSLAGDIGTRFGRLDARMDRFDARMDRFDARMDQFDARMDQFDARMDRLEAHMMRFDDKLDGFHQALRDQTRTYMFTMTGVVASFAAVVVAAGVLT